MKKTPLNAIHHQLGAKMVDFGGWEMPLHYGSQVDEHHKVRRHSGMFDVSHMLSVDLHGPGARDFLRICLANNVDKLKTKGRALYSCMLNPQGGVIDDLIVCLLDEDRFRVVVNAGTADKDLAWFEFQRQDLALNVRVVPRRELAMIAVQGPEARSAFFAAVPELRAEVEGLRNFEGVECGNGWFVSRTGYTGEDGFEIAVPAEAAEALWRSLLDAGVAPAGLGARDTLRLEAGMNLYGQDMDEQTTPHESGLGWTVSLADERNFIGKDALYARAAERRMCGLVLMDKGVLRGHQKVHTQHGEGEITSGTFSPTLNRSIALARVPSAVAAGETVLVDIRGRMLPALVVNYPFVRHGKPLVQV